MNAGEIFDKSYGLCCEYNGEVTRAVYRECTFRFASLFDFIKCQERLKDVGSTRVVSRYRGLGVYKELQILFR